MRVRGPQKTCTALTGVSGEWRRCTTHANVGARGWLVDRFGVFCPRHAPMAVVFNRGRVS